MIIQTEARNKLVLKSEGDRIRCIEIYEDGNGRFLISTRDKIQYPAVLADVSCPDTVKID